MSTSRKRSSVWIPIVPDEDDPAVPSSSVTRNTVIPGIDSCSTEAPRPVGPKLALALEECAIYHYEMMVHLPLCCCCVDGADTAPFENDNYHSRLGLHVLILGDGDGGILRQVVTQYDSNTVASITVVERDPVVVSVAKPYLDAGPYFEDERVSVVHTTDAAAVFLSNERNTVSKYHVILGDTLDPAVNPKSLYRALAPGGILCVPTAASCWNRPPSEMDWMAGCRDIFDTVEYAMVPTFPGGQMGFLLLARRQHNNNNNGSSRALCRIPVRRPRDTSQLKWYSPDMHRAAFVLPPLVQAQLQEYVKGNDLDDLTDSSLLVGRNGGSNSNGLVGETEPTYHCFCKDVADSLPHRIKNLFTDVSQDGADRVNEDGKCFPGVPSNCTII